MPNKRISMEEMLGKKYGNYTVLSIGQNYHLKCRCELCGRETDVLKYNLLAGTSTSCGCKNKIPDEEIVGKKFNELTVLEKSNRCYNYKKNTKVWLYKCRCSCGNITYVDKWALLKGKVVSCGHIYKEKIWKDTEKKMLGKKYGALTIIERMPNKIFSNGVSAPVWKCLCECGNTTIVNGNNLKGGMVKSCGCKRRIKKTPHKYTKEEDELILKHEITYKEIADRLGVSITSLHARKNALLNKKGENPIDDRVKWTPEEEKLLMSDMKPKELAAALNKSIDSIYTKRLRLKKENEKRSS